MQEFIAENRGVIETTRRRQRLRRRTNRPHGRVRRSILQKRSRPARRRRQQRVPRHIRGKRENGTEPTGAFSALRIDSSSSRPSYRPYPHRRRTEKRDSGCFQIHAHAAT